MKIKHTYSGSSLLELRKKFGIGSSGFYDNTWFLKEKFAKDKAPKGVYEIDVSKKHTNLTYEEQKSKLKKGWDFSHPAVLAEAILTHYKNTNKRLLEDWYSRTFCLDSDGDRVRLGLFGSGGLVVDGWWDDRRGSLVGLSSSWKLRNLKPRKVESFEDLNIEILKVKINGKVYELK